MRNTNKERSAELALAILRSPSQESKMLVELVAVMLDEARGRLVDAEGTDIYRAQGEARSLLRMHRALTIPPPNTESN